MAAGFRSALFILGVAQGPPELYGVPVAGPAVQLVVGDRLGNVLGQIRFPLVEGVTWEMGEAGSGSFVLAAWQVGHYFNAPLLQAGNRVLVECDNGLPAWVGVLTGSQEWREDGTVAFGMMGLAGVFGWRVTGAEQTFNGTLSDVVEYAAGLVGGLTMGTVEAGSGEVMVTYNYTRLSDVLRQLLPVGDFMMGITGSLTGGIIGGAVNVWRRGARVCDTALLVAGHNLGDVAYRVETGDLVNALYLAGEGTGWTEPTRAIEMVEDAGSVAAYGLREDALIVDGTNMVMLRSLGANLLGRLARPRRAVRATAVNRKPGLFGDYGVGDMVRVVLDGPRVDGYFELLGMEFRPENNTCDLALEAR